MELPLVLSNRMKPSTARATTTAPPIAKIGADSRTAGGDRRPGKARLRPTPARPEGVSFRGGEAGTSATTGPATDPTPARSIGGAPTLSTILWTVSTALDRMAS